MKKVYILPALFTGHHVLEPDALPEGCPHPLIEIPESMFHRYCIAKAECGRVMDEIAGIYEANTPLVPSP